MSLVFRFLRIVLVLAAVALAPVTTFGQGNKVPAWYGWHNPNQPYLRIFTNIDDIHRVVADTVFRHVPQLRLANLSELKLYYEGQEVPIFVGNGSNTGNDPARFDSGDWIEFMGRRLDASIDSFQYRDPFTGRHVPDAMPISTMAYQVQESVHFLTASSGPGRRFEPVDGTGTDGTEDNRVRLRSFFSFDGGYFRGKWNVLATLYHRGTYGSSDYAYFLNSEHTPAEGFAGAYIGNGFSRAVELPTFGAVAPGQENQAPVLHVRFSTIWLVDHLTRIEVGTTKRYDIASNGVRVIPRDFTLEQSDLRNSGSNTRVTFSPIGPTIFDEAVIGELWIDYDSRADFDNVGSTEIYRYTPGGSGIRRLLVRGMNVPAGDQVYLYDFANGRRVTGRVVPSTLTTGQSDVHFRMPAGLPSRLYITTSSRIRNGLRHRAARFAPQRLAQPNNGADMLIVAFHKARASAEAYANYRRNEAPTHSRMSVQVVGSDEMLNEFGYGHTASEPARQFFRYVYENWQRKPKHILLWSDVSLPDTVDYVPSWSYPPSDYLLLTGYDLDRNDMKPWASIGRVTIQSDAEGYAYLEKVRAYETQPYDNWMRQGLHMGGGIGQFEQQLIGSYLQNIYAPILTGFPLFGTLDYYQKTDDNPIPSTVTQRIRNAINGGITQLTFFGHSAATVFEIPLEQASNYNNLNKYPVIIALGCFSGDFQTPQGGQPNGDAYGEQFIKTPGKGAIAYSSVTGTGELGTLGEWARNYLRVALRDSIGKPLGNIFKRNYDEFTSIAPGSFRYLAHAHQMALLGDPAIRQRLPWVPDFAVSPQDIAPSTQNLNAFADRISVRLSFRNPARAIEDSVTYTLEHRVPASGYARTIRGKIRMTRQNDTLSVALIRGNGVWAGQHNLTFRVDPDNAVEELDESNNTASTTFNLESNIPLLIYPQPYGIVNRDTVALAVASFGGPSTTAGSWEVQVATDTSFANPLGSATLRGSTTGVFYRVPGTLQPNMVYYWRARNGANTPWALRSFVRGTATGWEQRTPVQFAQNITDNLSYQTAGNRWQFASSVRRGAWFLATPVGPAQQWQQVSWAFTSPDNPTTTDWLEVRVLGRRADNTDSLVAVVQGRSLTGTIELASRLNAARFPQLMLEVLVADTAGGTPLQPQFLRVTYQPLTQDLAMDPLVNYRVPVSQVAEGAPGTIQFAIRNLGPDVMTDSVPVRVNAFIPNQNPRVLREERLAPLGQNELRIVSVQLPSLNLPTNVPLQVQLNPAGTVREVQSANNQWTGGELVVSRDRSNPLLEVTVDGRHLMNGDRISPVPNLLAELRDENPYLPLSDTTVMELFLTRVGSNLPPRRLTFASGELRFTPGSAGSNQSNAARVEYKPLTPLADGRYQLSVQGFDARSNPAGTQPYRVEFEVRNRSAMTHVLNYPNPFTTSTKFVYSLSGMEVPEVFQIHIHTITGRLVKVIDLKALGEVRLGTHLTDYAWDGTDEFGDRLANGVYLYRVVMRGPGGKEIPIEAESNTGQYFKNGWGKMYLMR